MKKVMVLMGGLSSERDISLLSGEQVSAALKRAGYTVVTHDLTTDIPAFIATLTREKPDVVFNALHGRFGEDGCIAGLLNLMKIPYTHSGVLASAIGMDKDRARRLVGHIGLTVAAGGLMTKDTFLRSEPPFPYVIKPNDNGSSVGVFIVRSVSDRDQALQNWTDDTPHLVEQYIPGRELSVAVLDGKGIGIVEIVPQTGYYDFKNKYTDGGARHLIPAPIAHDIYQKALHQAEMAHQALGCRGVSRTDFRLDDETDPQNPELVFLEINTHPGMTKLSLVPDIAGRCQHMTYEQLVSHLVEEATCDA